MFAQHALFQTIQNIEQLEQVPLATRLTAGSTYELLRETTLKKPDTVYSLSAEHASLPGDVLTAHDFLGKVHQTANLLADLGLGPQDILALLLPDLRETHLLLWGGQAVGIVCPLLPCMPTEQVVELLQLVKAKVLVAPGPQVSQKLWRKAQAVRIRVKSIDVLLQIRGPGQERDTTYAFDTLLDDYAADRLCTNREIALDDIAIALPTKKATGTYNFTPLTHGHLLYTAWALSLVTTKEPGKMLVQNTLPLLQIWR